MKMMTAAHYGKTYTINILGGSVFYNVTWWHISDENNRLEFLDGDKTVITTLRYTVKEE